MIHSTTFTFTCIQKAGLGESLGCEYTIDDKWD